MYKVVIGTLFIQGVKYRRGDMVKLTEDQAASHGTSLEFVPEKPKRAPRKKKVAVSED